ncbi:MAG: pilus assembly protein TadG-related protein [Paracoccaceae bacterium]
MLWIMSLVAVVAFVALVFDMGRVQVTHGELQSFADSVALAAAGELDGNANAIARATAAAAEVADTNVDGGDGTLQGAGDYTLTFLSGLPEPDEDDDAYNPELASTAGYVATTDAAARMVQVDATPVSNTVGFLAATRALIGAAAGNTMSTSAQAIAGFTMEACDITPLMFCLPNGSWEAKNNVGQQILLRSGGTVGAWGPGDFGFLDVSDGAVGSTCAGLKGANLVGCLLGAEGNVTQCYSQRGVTMEPGQKEGLNASVFNTRFDRFTSTMNGEEDDARYTVAPNIVSGEVVNCTNDKVTVSTNSIGLPHDSNLNSCITSPSTCPRFGNKSWDYDTYFDTNHGDGNGTLFRDVDNPSLNEDAAFAALIPADFAGTRYGVYLAEIAQAGGATSLTNILTGRQETGRNSCSPNRSSDPKRRVVIAAGIDCTANGIAGAAKNVPVKEFVELFMTNPIGAGEGTGNTKTFNIWVEVIGSLGKSGYGGAGSGGVFRDVVQLYR